MRGEQSTRRPVVGLALLAIGVVHVMVTPLVAGDSLRSILDGGVVGAVEDDPALLTLRSHAFWYVTAGIGMIVLGVVVHEFERATGRVPAALGWLLVAMGLWGVVLMPLSPFWAFPVVAILAFRSAPQQAPRRSQSSQ